MAASHLRIAALLLLALVPRAASVACNGFLSYTPDPLLALRNDTVMRSSLPMFLSAMMTSYTPSCLPAYSSVAVEVSSDAFVLPPLAEWTLTQGSSRFYACHQVTRVALCSVSRIVPWANRRGEGTSKLEMLASSPSPVWEAVPANPAQLSSFTLKVAGGPDGWTTLEGSGFAFELCISRHKECQDFQLFYDSSNISLSVTELSVSIPAVLANGIYAICLRIWKDGFALTDWFPMAAAQGHSLHNLNIGTSISYVQWGVQLINATRRVYREMITIIVDASVLTMPWQRFALDASLDVCSPLMNSSFLKADLGVYNASHVAVNTSLTYMSEAGRESAVLCASLGEDEPWVLVSQIAIEFWHCAQGYDKIAVYGCFACPGLVLVNDSGVTHYSSCNTAGQCGTLDATHCINFAKCICYSRFYGGGCEYFEFDDPVISVPNGTYAVRSVLVVDISIGEFADYIGVHFSNGTWINSTERLILPAEENYTFVAYSLAYNGSSSTGVARKYSVLFQTITPTLTQSLSAPSRSLTRSSSQSATVISTASMSLSSSLDAPDSQTVSRSLSTVSSLTSSVALSQTTSALITPTKRSQSASRSESHSVSSSFGASHSSSNSRTASRFASMSDTKAFPKTISHTSSDTSTPILSPSAGLAQTASESIARSKTITCPVSQSISSSFSRSAVLLASDTPTVTMSTTLSISLSATPSESPSESSTDTGAFSKTISHTSSGTGTPILSPSAGLAQTASESIARSKTITCPVSQSISSSPSPQPTVTMWVSSTQTPSLSGGLSASLGALSLPQDPCSISYSSLIFSSSTPTLEHETNGSACFATALNGSTIVLSSSDVPSGIAAFRFEGPCHFECRRTTCTEGITAACAGRVVNISASYVSPAARNCNATFSYRTSSLAEHEVHFHWNIEVEPLPVVRTHLWRRHLDRHSGSEAVWLLVGYKAAQVPYHTESLQVRYGDCGLPIPNRILQKNRLIYCLGHCFTFIVENAGFRTSESRVSVPSEGVKYEAFLLSPQQKAAAPLIAVQRSTWSWMKRAHSASYAVFTISAASLIACVVMRRRRS